MKNSFVSGEKAEFFRAWRVAKDLERETGIRARGYFSLDVALAGQPYKTSKKSIRRLLKK